MARRLLKKIASSRNFESLASEILTFSLLLLTYPDFMIIFNQITLVHTARPPTQLFHFHHAVFNFFLPLSTQLF